MQKRLWRLFDRLFSTYWFVPATMSVVAILLSFAATTLDGWLGSDWMHDVSWLWSNKPEGARALLSTLAGSMITVGGVTFSVTIASVAYTSSQFAPRLLTNFMQDRGNQFTLGTFVATFLYCLLVLRTVRGSGDGSTGSDLAFVPHISILLATVLAIASVGVLIYFMHHIPESINASTVIATIGQELLEHVSDMFPTHLGHPLETADNDALLPDALLPDGFHRVAAMVTSEADGYLQDLDSEYLLSAAQKRDLVLEMLVRPGDYIMSGQPLLLAYPPGHVNEATVAELRRCFSLGERRTPAQDSLFLVNELAQIAARALSPGVNDPFTAISCLHWLKSALARVVQGHPPAAGRRDDQGTLRVVAHPLEFHDFHDAAFEQLRPYVAADRNSSLAYLQSLKDLMVSMKTDEQRAAIADLGKGLAEGAASALGRWDNQAVEESLSELLRLHGQADARTSFLRRKHCSDGGG